MSISDYSTTPASNTSISGINIAEGCSPAGINNAIRQMMADIAADARSVPTGGIIMWSGSIASIPATWALCDGTSGTPDLRDRFIAGAGGTYAPNTTGGANSVTLTMGQMPSHTHTGSTDTASLTGTFESRRVLSGADLLTAATGIASSSNGPDSNTVEPNSDTRARNRITINASHSHAVTVGAAGSGQSHENRPPYYALAYIMKL